MAHTTLTDSAGDGFFIIDPITRVISPGGKKTKVMQYDHNSEMIYFQLKTPIEGHPMEECNKIEVHYINGATTGVYEVSEIIRRTEIPEVGTAIFFSWTLSQNVTMNAGQLIFLIRFSCVAEDGTIEYAWNTEPCMAMSVAKGMYNSDAIVEQYADVLEQWRLLLWNSEKSGITNITAAADEAKAQLDSKANTLLSSIPDDYNIVSDKVKEHDKAINTLNDGGLVLKNDVIERNVEEWLDEHPEATTTVQDGSITVTKLFKNDLPFLSPEMFGAVGDGITDDTAAIQNMVAYGKENDVTSFIFGSGKTYIVSLPNIEMSADWATNTQRSQKNKKVINVDFANARFDLNKSTIKLSGNMYPYYSIFYINGDNCTISNGIIKGEKNEHDYTTFIYRKEGEKGTHEFGFGIEQVECSNLVVDNVEICNTTGDAIITGDATGICTTIIKNCNLHHCRRQGLSCLGADKMHVYDTEVHHIGTSDGTSGTAPMSGIDIEPDSGTRLLNYFYMNNVKVGQCNGCAFIIGGAVTKADIYDSYLEGIVNVVDALNFYDCKFVFDQNSLMTKTVYSLWGTYNNCDFDISDHTRFTDGYVSVIGTYIGCVFNGTVDENGKSIALLVKATADTKNCIFNNIKGNATYPGIYTQQALTKQIFEGIELHNSVLSLKNWSKDLVLRSCVFEDSAVNLNKTDTLKFQDCTFINCTSSAPNNATIIMDNCFYSNKTDNAIFYQACKIIRNSYIELLSISNTTFYNTTGTVGHFIANTTIKFHEAINMHLFANKMKGYNVILDTNYNTQEEVAKYPGMVNTIVASTELVQ